MARGGSGVVISSQSGHRLRSLSPEQDRALATTPAEALLSVAFLQAEQVKDSLHAYQLSKRSTAKTWLQSRRSTRKPAASSIIATQRW
jgi:hypothetical protein